MSCDRIMKKCTILIIIKKCLLCFSEHILAVTRPFRIQFKTDEDELPLTAIGGGGDATDSENIAAPGGIIGFNINFRQISC